MRRRDGSESVILAWGITVIMFFDVVGFLLVRDLVHVVWEALKLVRPS